MGWMAPRQHQDDAPHPVRVGPPDVDHAAPDGLALLGAGSSPASFRFGAVPAYPCPVTTGPSAATFSASRRTFPSGLGRRSSRRDDGSLTTGQSACWCQKHPRTWTASLGRENMTSGFPGKSRRQTGNLSLLCRAGCTAACWLWLPLNPSTLGFLKSRRRGREEGIKARLDDPVALA